MRQSRDNIPGIEASWPVLIFLLPGMIWQWLTYMTVSGSSYGSVRQRTRNARSPLMTWVYSGCFWFLVGYYFFGQN